MLSQITRQLKLYASPWMTISISLILMSVVTVLGVMNYSREKSFMIKLLTEKGTALVRSFEVGERTGMMSMMLRTHEHLQIHIEQTALLPDISYISIVDLSGTIVAHNDKSKIGQEFDDCDFIKLLSPSEKTMWRIITKENKINYFEVYKSFILSSKNTKTHHMTSQEDMRMNSVLNPENPSYIFVGMDIEPFEKAMVSDLRHNIVMGLMVFFLGMAGVVSLFWARNFTRSRKLLLDTKAFAAEVVANLPVGIVVLNTDNHITYINEVACTLLKKSMEESKGHPANQILPVNVWELLEFIKGKQAVAVKEVTLMSSDNKELPVMVSATHMIGGTGNFLGDMFVLKDLSEIRQLEIKSRQNEKLAAIGNLAAGIAHEVRNPLSSIKGYVTFFGSLFEKESENRKAANLMADEVDRVNRVISELLEFAKPSDLKLDEVETATLINHSIRIITHEAEISGIEIIIKIDPDLPRISADLDRLTQVLLNLYINAIQSMKKGGQLSVYVKNKGGHIVIKISDTGKGISSKDQKDIFNPYFTTKKNGTGLGLAIAYKIIENHKGSISVTSKENFGTTFSITLPVSQKKAKTA